MRPPGPPIRQHIEVDHLQRAKVESSGCQHAQPHLLKRVAGLNQRALLYRTCCLHGLRGRDEVEWCTTMRCAFSAPPPCLTSAPARPPSPQRPHLLLEQRGLGVKVAARLAGAAVEQVCRRGRRRASAAVAGTLHSGPDMLTGSSSPGVPFLPLTEGVREEGDREEHAAQLGHKVHRVINRPGGDQARFFPSPPLPS